MNYVKCAFRVRLKHVFHRRRYPSHIQTVNKFSFENYTQEIRVKLVFSFAFSWIAFDRYNKCTVSEFIVVSRGGYVAHGDGIHRRGISL